MTEILLSSRPLPLSSLQLECTYGEVYNSTGATQFLNAHQPYTTTDNIPIKSQHVLNAIQQASKENIDQIIQLSNNWSSDALLAISEITAPIKDLSINTVGASTSVYSGRMKAFAIAVQDYQNALLRYRDANKANLAPRVRQGLKQQVFTKYTILQRRFDNELKVITNGIKSRKGTPLTSAQRGLNIAKSSRHVSKLLLTSQAEANSLLRLTKHSKILGNGLTVIDFTSRIANVKQHFQQDRDWEREMFKESLSFAGSVMTATVVAEAGTAALVFALGLTPVGWVGLLIGGLAVAGAAGYGALKVNDTLKENSDIWYDAIMDWLSTL